MMADLRIRTSEDDKLSPEVEQHRSEAYGNGDDDALDDVRDALQTAIDDSNNAGLRQALRLLEILEQP